MFFLSSSICNNFSELFVKSCCILSMLFSSFFITLIKLSLCFGLDDEGRDVDAEDSNIEGESNDAVEESGDVGDDDRLVGIEESSNMVGNGDDDSMFEFIPCD